MTISFDVRGMPSPKGSKTAVVRGSRAVLLDGRRGPSRAAHGAWKGLVAAEACVAMLGQPALLDGPLGVSIVFRLPRPKHQTRTQKARAYQSVKPDIDKLARTVFDVLTGIVITDDSRIAVAVLRKVYASSSDEIGASISVSTIPDGP